MGAKVFKSNRHQVWRVIIGGYIIKEYKEEELAIAYCEGYNVAFKEMNELLEDLE